MFPGNKYYIFFSFRLTDISFEGYLIQDRIQNWIFKSFLIDHVLEKTDRLERWTEYSWVSFPSKAWNLFLMQSALPR